MIVTLTPNPSLDRTIEVARLVRGAVIRATSSRLDPGGKGVNVVRVLLRNGYPARAVAPTGGTEGAQLAALLADQGIDLVPVPIAAPVRCNVSVVEPDGAVTKLNEPGPALTAGEVEDLVAATVKSAVGADWVVCCGSLPPGVSPDFYARLVELLHAQGLRVAVDASEAPLVASLAARPDVIKPNQEELAQAVGRSLHTFGEVLSAARELHDAGVGSVLVSLGADGALLVNEQGVAYGHAPVAAVRSAVGAGDATLAGFLAAGARGRTALAEALAWGAAACRLPGSRMPGPEDLDRAGVRLDHPFPTDRPLQGDLS